MKNNNQHELSTKEDKNIKYALLLLEDNSKKLKLIDKLNSCIDRVLNDKLKHDLKDDFL